MILTRFSSGIPAAPGVGPFAHSPFLETIWRHTAGPGDDLHIVGDREGVVALWYRDGRMEMVGPEHLVDYRSPIGAPTEALTDALRGLPRGMAYRFDSLPVEAADIVEESLNAAGLRSEPEVRESAAVLNLPTSFDDYMAGIAKKERHETRRKTRRFIEARGQPRIVTYRQPGPVLERFFRLHRLADGAKSEFMTPTMTRLFIDLVSIEGWQVDALYGDASRAIAITVSYVDETGYYLYNSAYDPSARDSSPGVVLLSLLVERAIDERLDRFDFLKGDESYKYKMGAEARPLYAFEGTT